MLRVLLTILLPLLLPTIIYVVYTLLTNRRRAGAGMPADPVAKDMPWLWLLATGVALMASFLVALALLGGHDKDSMYIPAHVGPDGRSVPARTVPRDQTLPQ